MRDIRVGIASSPGTTYSSGIGQVCIPPNVDRNTFVQTCLNTGMISVQPQTNSAIHRVRCDSQVLQNLDFPLTSNTFGSYVVYVFEPKQKIPYVVASFNSIDEYNDLKEHQFRLTKSTDYGTVTLIGDANGQMSISVTSSKNKKGRFDISVSNPDNTAQFNINIKGSTTLYSSDNITISSNAEVFLESTDGESSSKISLSNKKIKFDSGEEQMVLGNTLIEKLEKLLDLLTNAKVATSIGLQPLNNFAEYTKLKEELNEFLSEKAILD